jgi:dihydrofolate reductase
MAGKVFFTVAMTLDGFIAPESGPEDIEALRGGTTTPSLKRWMAQWMELQKWAFKQRFFRENLKLGSGGQEGVDNAVLEETYNRTGASIMGKRMFDGGEHQWPEEAPFHTPVYVVTHEVREPWERPGGTTFNFVNDGIESALKHARTAAGDRDVRIAGGAETILQYLNAGLVDEFTISLAPVFFGTGVRLFDRVDASRITLDMVQVKQSPMVTHLSYPVRWR